ncbi:hypothetical protein LRD69_29730 [Streptomyces sp. JH14]|uniref:hypothetical protein n=1 Tax=Streptomyces sp. JH14 TaxID=2793630 RepID=UPI0023F9E3B2|nr:hypothetical protein [Streptomyces sp. JH14]MDF6046233.1 hypothetical protein [Streptomyces sp. JH14]
MVSAARTAHHIEITTESLQEDLARLEVQRQALERELTAVVAHLGSVQRALGALQALMSETGDTVSSDITGTAEADHGTAPSPAQPHAETLPPDRADATAAPVHRTRRPERRPETQKPAPPAARSGATTDSRTATDGDTNYGRLTEQILEYFAGVGNVDVRARDVAAVLGRDTDSGSINTVRSTLDRLVGASRIRRTGRGLYRAKKS